MATDNEALKYVDEAIAQSDVAKAISEMEAYLTAYPELRMPQDSLEEVKRDYALMADYWKRGYRDPQLETLYRKLLQRLYVASTDMKWANTVSRSPFLTALYRRVRQQRRDWSVDGIRSEMEGFVSEVALLQLEPAHKRQAGSEALYKAHQQRMNDLFDYVFTSRSWSERVGLAFEEMLLSPTLDTNDQQLLVAAIMLSAMNHFDMVKFRVLAIVYRHSADEAVRQRALVGWVLAMDASVDNVYPEQRALIEEMLQQEDTCRELTDLQKQLIYCLNAERDTQKIQSEIMPDLLKNNSFRITRNGIEEVEEDAMENILHPEAAEEKMEKVEAGFRKMMEMQKQGSDIYFGGFSQMKRFPFFNETANWLVPFYLAHPAISPIVGKMNGNRFLEQMMAMGPFCNSDKYSFVIAFQQVVERIPAHLREMMERGEARMSEIEPEAMQTPAYIRRIYLQDLYRFFRIFPHRSVLRNPFDPNLGPLGECCFFAGRLLSYQSALAGYKDEVVRLLMKQGIVEEACRLLRSYDEAHRTADYYVLVGNLLVQHPQHQAYFGNALTARRCFELALQRDGQHQRALQGYARCLFADSCYGQALEVYDRLLQLQPDKRSFHLNKSVCLINLQQYEEALKILYRLNYEAPDDDNVNRVMAWALTCSGRLEQAEKKYSQMAAGESHLAEDKLNEGYCHWLQGHIEAAADCFNRYLATEGVSEERDFLFRERELLSSNGITDTDIRLMTGLLQR